MSKISHRKELISLCHKYKLPLNVRSTSIKIYNIISGKLPVDSLLYTILVVSAKCEDVHEINIPLKALKNEGEVHEALNFEYDFPSPYIIMSSILVKLQLTRNITHNITESNYDIMDRLLINDDGEFTDFEKACAALEIPDSIVEAICRLERVKECRKLLIKGDY